MNTILALIVMTIANANLEINLQKANEAYSNGEYTKAIDIYKKALKEGENPALAYFNLGNCYYQMDSVAQAISNYYSATLDAPDFFNAHLNLGILYFNLEDMPQCIASLERARALEPKNGQTLLVLASAYIKLQKYELAAPIAEQALENDTSLADGYFILCDIYRRCEDPFKAKSWIERYPDNGKRVKDKIEILAELTKETIGPSAATFYYQKLIELDPKRKWSYFSLVENLYSSGNVLVALESADAALKKFPDFKELSLYAGDIAFQAQYYWKAQNYYSSAFLSGSSGGLVGLQNLAKVYQAQGDNAKLRTVNELLMSDKNQ